MLKILIEDADGNSKTAPIDPANSEITIGRKEGNFIRLKERNVSRHHARIFQGDDGKLYVEPVAARYGLKVNSKKINGPIEIALGDEIKVGDYHLYIQDANAVDFRKDAEQSNQVMDIVPQLQPRFVVVSSNFAGVEYHITRTKVVIGRNPECDICIQHNSISGTHAEIRRTNRGDFEITDLKSSNGTKVNGIPINEPFKLSSGDTLTLGHVIMRYCGPGDFWSLNFGINDNPRSNALPIALAIVAICIAVVGVVLIVNLLNNQPQQTIVQEDSAALAEQIQQTKLLEFTAKCGDAMQEGELENAELYCNEAKKIDPRNPNYVAKAEQLKRELSARNALEELRSSIEDKKCRRAIEIIEAIDENTWAYRYMLKNDLKAQANECLENFYYERATAAIEAGEIVNAEIARDELKNLNEKSPLISKINDDIRELKHPRGSSSGSSKSSGSGAPSAAPAAAPAAAPKESVESVCQQAGKAKLDAIKTTKNYCPSVKLYKKALSLGATGNCKKFAEDLIKAHPEC